MSHREGKAAAVQRGLALPLELVHRVPALRVAPAALVILETAVAGPGGRHLRGGRTDARRDGNVVDSDVSKSVPSHHALEHDLWIKQCSTYYVGNTALHAP